MATLDLEMEKSDLALQKLEERKKVIENKKMTHNSNKEHAARVLAKINQILE